MQTRFFQSCFLLLFAAALASPGRLAAEEPKSRALSLDQAVKEALEANLQLKGEDIRLGIKKRDKDLAGNKLFPTLSVGTSVIRLNDTKVQTAMVAYDASPSNPHSVYFTPDAMNLRFTLNAQFVFSWATLDAIKQASIDYENSRLSYDAAAQRLGRDVRKLFYQLLVLQETLTLTRRQLDNAQERFRQAELNYKTGLAPELAALQAQVAWENRKPALDDLKVSYDQALFAFENLLGREPDPALVLEGSLDFPIPPKDPKAGELLDKFFLRRLDVQSAVGQVRTAEGIERMQRDLSLPSFFVQFSADPTLNDPWNPKTKWASGNWFQQSGALVLGLSWKLDGFLPGSSQDNQVRDFRDQVQAARLGLDQLRLAAGTEVLTLAEKITKSRKALASLARNVDVANRAYELTDKAYRAGSRSLLEVQDAELQYQAAQLLVLNEKQALNSSLLDLETALNATREEIYGN